MSILTGSLAAHTTMTAPVAAPADCFHIYYKPFSAYLATNPLAQTQAWAFADVANFIATKRAEIEQGHPGCTVTLVVHR